MKKLLCGLLCLLMLLGCASADGYLYSAKGDNGLWGHIDETGNWGIPPKFDSAGDFRGNYAWIQQGDREGFANRDGEIVLLLDENVVTDSEYRGRGLATACLERAKEIAKTENCYRLILMTGTKLDSTLNFYRKAGYDDKEKTGFIQYLD